LGCSRFCGRSRSGKRSSCRFAFRRRKNGNSPNLQKQPRAYRPWHHNSINCRICPDRRSKICNSDKIRLSAFKHVVLRYRGSGIQKNRGIPFRLLQYSPRQIRFKPQPSNPIHNNRHFWNTGSFFFNRRIFGKIIRSISFKPLIINIDKL